MNQGTLVVFNLDPSITNDDLHGIFGAHGEIKEVYIFILRLLVKKNIKCLSFVFYLFIY